MDIQCKTTTHWCADDTRIVEELPNGRYNVSDWHHLDEAGLVRLHAVLGHVLTDIAAGKGKKLEETHGF